MSGYALIRRLISLGQGKLRLLHAEETRASGPIILVATPMNGVAAAGWRQALVLVRALDRPVTCLIETGQVKGFLASQLCRTLRMIPYEPTKEGIVAGLKAARERLEQGEAVAILTSESARKSGEPPTAAQMAATLGLSTMQRFAGRVRVSFLPVHILLPIEGSRRRETLLYFGAPRLLDAASLPAERGPATREITVELERALRENPFCLPPKDVEVFLKDLEQLFRSALEEDWSGRTNWKQTLDGFALSRFVADWIEQLDAADPGRLIAWRHALEMYREGHRQWSLRQAEVGAAGEWFHFKLARTWYGLESIVGAPIAFYGLLNHLVAGAALLASGLLKKKSKRDRRAAWAQRALVVLGCYVLQILLCAHWLGRAAAGYYVLTLPTSGAFAWHYRWLLRARTRLLLLSLRLPARAAAIRERRRKLIDDLNAARDRYAATLGVAQ